MTSFFSAEGGLIWVTFRRLVQNDMSTAVMWSKSKPDVKFQYGGRWANSMACHLRATYHIAGCNNSIRHIENRFSPYFVFFCFYDSLGFDERRLSYRLRYTCLIQGK